MKLNILFILLFISSLSYSQNPEINLEFSGQILVTNKNTELGVFEFCLRIRNSKNGDEDYYTFLANTNGNSSFEDNGVEIPAIKYITVEDLKSKTPCELHDYLSKQGISFVKIINGKYKRWFVMYTGTYRNIQITKLKGKI
ncbi:hypothetical protein FEDK69T_04020 [Flavobacterium enshiense DK69]|uniref:Uncharacterized protein n=1 Tax=Flavobacterium enshiense DK69 TaxID=1107311 RepID=V6SEF7_9FLAO|nr:hypothetical protein [Flavobacterium enshiense]ESU24849.1 hypothetical protein FEDK69T_04020 [Flavobacterium enshiense DK69]KGO96701.1 hypothetical protein Q767_03055 [Flavobacterium enshiense DK69]